MFSTAQIVEAAGVSPQTAHYLLTRRAKDVGPTGVEAGEGQGRHRKFSELHAWSLTLTCIFVEHGLSLLQARKAQIAIDLRIRLIDAIASQSHAEVYARSARSAAADSGKATRLDGLHPYEDRAEPIRCWIAHKKHLAVHRRSAGALPGELKWVEFMFGERLKQPPPLTACLILLNLSELRKRLFKSDRSPL